MRTADDYHHDVIPRVFVPVLRELLTSDEFDTVELSVGSDRIEEASGAIVLGADEWWLKVVVCGEPMWEWIVEQPAGDLDLSEWTDAARAERFYSNMQDFISESTFGWGQLRGHL